MYATLIFIRKANVHCSLCEGVELIQLTHLDNLVVVYVVQGIGSIPSSNNRGVGQEVGTVDAILKVKLEKCFG